jgi:hypothetical protein
MVAPVSEFLMRKYKSGEPSAMFAAIRTWEDYLNRFHQNRGAELLSDNLFLLYKPFNVYGKYKPWQDEAAAALSVALHDGESGVELWYPVAKRPFETVVAFTSFLPIIFYYTHKISEWNYVFQQCKICDAHFLARSRHYELCSDECRKKQATTAKKEFDERTKGDEMEQLDKATYFYWYNRWRSLKKRKSVNPDKVAAFKSALDDFRSEAKKHKNAVKRGEMDEKDFTDWLFQMQNEADKQLSK